MADSKSAELLNAICSVFPTDKGAVLQPGSEAYDEANNSYFSALETTLKPSYIVQPSSAEQVQGLVEALRPHILAGDCSMAIRGEGHTPFAGSANIQDGVTVDLRRLKGISLSADQTTVKIAVGESWTTVYKELEQHGLTTPGGRVGRIGIAGFILGGGLSMLSTRTGFACDFVTEFRVVLSSGKHVSANAFSNSDLWISLKGGLNNFGIVTSITMRTLKSESIWGGITYYTPGAFTQVLRNACDFATNETDEDTHVMCSAGYGFGQHAVTCGMYHTRGEEDSPALRRFTTIQPQIEHMATMRVDKHHGFCEELSTHCSSGMRQYWASITIKPSLALLEAFHDKWQATLAQIKDANGFIFTLGFHLLTKALLKNSLKAGGNAMNIFPQDGPLFVVMINPIWTDAQDDDGIIAAVEKLVADLRGLASQKGLLHRYIFANYAYHKDDVIAGYGEASANRMRAVSKKYDPEGMFQQGVPGGFKLSW